MTEKHNWVTDDLCLIEETTGVKLYGTVCTDISFIAKQLNMANKTIRELEGENEQLKEHQRTLEAKIVRLKDRVKTFEKHYSLKDIERKKIQKTSLEDIIGIVKTDEPTNSVELKKELYK